MLSIVALAQSPTTVIHIINVKWKAEATSAKIKAAIDASESRFFDLMFHGTLSMLYAQRGVKNELPMIYR